MNGAELEIAAQDLSKTMRDCTKCGRKHNELKNPDRAKNDPRAARHFVRPVLLSENILEWGCEICFPPHKEPRENKELIASLTIPMFSDPRIG